MKCDITHPSHCRRSNPNHLSPVKKHIPVSKFINLPIVTYIVTDFLSNLPFSQFCTTVRVSHNLVHYSSIIPIPQIFCYVHSTLAPQYNLPFLKLVSVLTLNWSFLPHSHFGFGFAYFGSKNITSFLNQINFSFVCVSHSLFVFTYCIFLNQLMNCIFITYNK